MTSSRTGGWLVAAAAGIGVSLAALCAGCGEMDRDAPFARRTVAVSEVPQEVMAAAKKGLPGVDFAEAWKNVDREGNLMSYEVRGRASNGKIREVRVAPDGAILEME